MTTTDAAKELREAVRELLKRRFSEEDTCDIPHRYFAWVQIALAAAEEQAKEPLPYRCFLCGEPITSCCASCIHHMELRGLVTRKEPSVTVEHEPETGSSLQTITSEVNYEKRHAHTLDWNWCRDCEAWITPEGRKSRTCQAHRRGNPNLAVCYCFLEFEATR